MRAVVRSAEGRIVVHTAHPYPSVIQTITPLRIPVGYDPTERDAVIERVRERVAADLDADVPVVLLGDFNVAPTEPGFDVLTRGLVDAHRAVGNGPGWTWRPSRLEGLGIGVLRIDYVLTSGFQPLSIETDCRNAGDHCIVTAGLDLADR
jgi:endonuclease/exonuclease/phosphatase family metal-dependent hydrolase